MYGKVWNPVNRFDGLDFEWEEPPPTARLEVVEDHTQQALSRIQEPDIIGMRWGLNPYRGCTHACAYCYARRFHEFLGWGAGSDFERRILIKPKIAERLAETFARPSWRGEAVLLGSATDPYQPLERRYGLTRACLEVLVAHRNPVGLITRSPAILRDLDLLSALAEHGAVGVSVSIPIADRDVCRAIEPGAPSPDARFEAIARLSEAGVPVSVSLAPLIPGLGDSAIPETLRRAREAGAQAAWFSLLRLQGSVAEVFTRRLREALPLRADAVIARYERARGQPVLPGEGAARHAAVRTPPDPAWAATQAVFRLWHDKLGYGAHWTAPDPSPFVRPTAQLRLF